MPPQDDNELMDRYRRGDQTAFQSLYDRYERYVFAIVSKVLRMLTHHHHQECAQEVWMSLHRFSDEYRPGNFKAYLATIAANQARDYGRALGRRIQAQNVDDLRDLPLEYGEPSESDTTDAANIAAPCLYGCFAESPPKEQEILEEMYFPWCRQLRRRKRIRTDWKPEHVSHQVVMRLWDTVTAESYYPQDVSKVARRLGVNPGRVYTACISYRRSIAARLRTRQ